MTTQRPDDLIRALMRAGWSQVAIARSVGVRQPTISRILHGVDRSPRYHVVDALRQLVAELDHSAAEGR